MDAEISLRPLSLRPGGANPFAGFAKGAGAGLKNKVGRGGACELPGRRDARSCRDGSQTRLGLTLRGVAVRGRRLGHASHTG